MKILSATILAVSLTLAGLAAASPASGFVSPETAAAAQRANAESRAAELGLDIRHVVATCDGFYLGFPRDNCVARRVNAFISQRTYTPAEPDEAPAYRTTTPTPDGFAPAEQCYGRTTNAEGNPAGVVLNGIMGNCIFSSASEAAGATCSTNWVETDADNEPISPHTCAGDITLSA